MTGVYGSEASENPKANREGMLLRFILMSFSTMF